MNLIVPREISSRLKAELRGARRVEIGGLLFGEDLCDDTFRIADLTVQRTGGTRAHFVRDPEQHATQLASFFDHSGRDYTRFNYLGEWHSHPSFPPTPSPIDVAEMSRLITDPAVGASFVVLLIVRLRPFGLLAATASLFVRDRDPMPVHLVWGRQDSSRIRRDIADGRGVCSIRRSKDS
jgi:proteasome lid subunit RPN8/RPN11